MGSIKIKIKAVQTSTKDVQATLDSEVTKEKVTDRQYSATGW